MAIKIKSSKNRKEAAPVRPPSAWSGRRVITVLSIGLAFLLLYLFTWDRMGQFDAVVSAHTIVTWKKGDALTVLCPPNHYVFNPVGKWLHEAVGVRLNLESYQSLQLLNSLTGALGIAVIAAMFIGAGTVLWTLSGLLLLGLGRAYWIHSVGGLSYIMGAVFIIAAMLAVKRYIAKPAPLTAAAVMLAGVGACYAHTGNVAAIPALVAAVILFAPRGKRILNSAAMALTGLLAGLPYVLTYKLYSKAYFAGWLAAGSYANKTYDPKLAETSWQVNIFSNFTATVSAFFRAQSSYYNPGFAALTLLALLSLYLSAVKTDTSDAMRRWAKTLWGMWLGMSVFYLFWQPGNENYWCVNWSILVCAVMAEGMCHPRLRELVTAKIDRRVFTALALACALIIGAANLAKDIRFQHNRDNYPLVSLAQELEQVLPPKTVLLISGLRWPELKPYIYYYSKRERIGLEFELIAMPPDTAMAKLEECEAHFAGYGIPYYAASDIWDPKVREEMKARWGLEPQALDAVLAHFRPEKVFSKEIPGADTFTLYKMVPLEQPKAIPVSR